VRVNCVITLMSFFARRFKAAEPPPVPVTTSKTNPLMFLDDPEMVGELLSSSGPTTPDSKSTPTSPPLGSPKQDFLRQRSAPASLALGHAASVAGDSVEYLPGTPYLGGGGAALRRAAGRPSGPGPSGLPYGSSHDLADGVGGVMDTPMVAVAASLAAYDGNQTPKRAESPSIGLGATLPSRCGERFFMSAALQLLDHKERSTAGVVEIVPVLHTMLASTFKRRSFGTRCACYTVSLCACAGCGHGRPWLLLVDRFWVHA
jgi:hypothetical protein